MTYDPNKHHRRSIRLKGYDYSRVGAYFVTIVTQGRECLFGQVVDGEMRVNDAGRMVQAVWDQLPVFYPGVQVDAFIVMPNHIHGIIVLTGHPVGAGPRACPNDTRACPNDPSHPVGAGPRACPDNVPQGIGQPRGTRQPQETGQPRGHGNHRRQGNHGGLPLRCRCRMWCTGSKP